MRLIKLAFVLLTLFSTGCSFSKVKGTLAGNENQKMRLLAALPVERAADLPRERVDLIRRRVIGELQSKGFVVVEDAVVQRICSTPACPEKSKLAKDYGVDGFVALRVDSVSRANFLAGYVNTISGGISVQNLNGEELLSVSHSERERGGIIFNTGQVAQAIRTTASNTDVDQSFASIASRYAKALVSKVPRPENSGEFVSRVNAQIKDVKVSPDRFDSSQICLSGTKGGLAYIVFDKERANLREVQPGKYCGRYRSQDLANFQNLSVELRSVYGDIDEQKLSFKNDPVCRPKDPLVFVKSSNKAELSVVCSNNVPPAKFNVYRSSGGLSPFERVASVKGDRWIAPVAQTKKDQVYAVVVLGNAGQQTTPVLATISE